MNEIEERLKQEKSRIDELETPKELESRLRIALADKRARKRNIPPYLKLIASIVVVCILLGYNYNALAYYGKQIFGFEEIESGTLQQLNKAGMGQIINKSYSLGGGAQLIIDGIMTDENRMIVYYTLTDPSGNVHDVYENLFKPPMNITGFFTDSFMSSGHAKRNQDQTELKGMLDFEPPNAFAKKLTLHFSQVNESNQWTEKEVTFSYNPNKAMESSIKQKIKEKVKVDSGSLKFKSIIASPTLTVIKGSTDVEDFDRVPLPFEHVQLLANGKPVDSAGGGFSSGITGTTFELEFDALPEHLESLEIRVEKFYGYKELNQEIDLSSALEQTIDIGGEELVIKEIETNSEGTEVRIETDSSVLLDEVQLVSGQERTSLETTVNQTIDKKGEAMIKIRTLLFDTTEKPDKMLIGGMQYMREYNKTIEIPID